MQIKMVLTRKKVIQKDGEGGLSVCTYMARHYIDYVNMMKSHWETSEKRFLNNLQIVHNVLLIILRE